MEQPATAGKTRLGAKSLRFLPLVLMLLLVAGILLVDAITNGPAQAADQARSWCESAPGSTPGDRGSSEFCTEYWAGCQPVSEVALGYTPTLVYPKTAILLGGEILTGSLPITYSWDFGDGTIPLMGTASSAVLTASHSYTATGLFTVTLSAWNTCTQPVFTTTTPVTVTARPCLTVTGLGLTYTPTRAYTYTEVFLVGAVVTGSLPVTYTWSLGDGTPPITGTAESPVFTVAHVYTDARSYTATLAAWNRCTITPAERAVTLTVRPCEPISDVAVSYWPIVPRSGQVITFTASVTGEVPPSTFVWAFGDGQSAAGAVVTHTYTAPLSYTVALTASNPCSQRTATATLEVVPLQVQIFLPQAYKAFEPPGPPAEHHLGYGANIASADHVISMTVMGFDWAKGWVSWSDVGAGPTYNWINVDNQMAQFVPRVSHVLLRLHSPTPPGIGNPPTSPSDLAAFEDFALALAVHVSDTWRIQGLETIAYEIWNEPNLDYEWGGPPNAAQYTALLQAGYQGIKAGDPQAIVVGGALATTGDSAAELAWAREYYGADQVVGDLTFLRNMYANGAKGYFDAFGSHPYGGSYPPDTPRDQVVIPVYFRRAEEQRQVMIDHGDDSPVWATEFGWVLRTDACDLGEHEWMEVSEAQQAQYLTAAYAYADENWRWMGPMFLFNLDFATVYWYAECDPMRWYSITYRENPYDPGNSPIRPRQAFYSLRDMPKHSAW